VCGSSVDPALVCGLRPARPGRARLGVTLEPLPWQKGVDLGRRGSCQGEGSQSLGADCGRCGIHAFLREHMVCQRESARKRERDRDRETERQRDRESASETVRKRESLGTPRCQHPANAARGAGSTLSCQRYRGYSKVRTRTAPRKVLCS
jgi:hypothetical protein